MQTVMPFRKRTSLAAKVRRYDQESISARCSTLRACGRSGNLNHADAQRILFYGLDFSDQTSLPARGLLSFETRAALSSQPQARRENQIPIRSVQKIIQNLMDYSISGNGIGLYEARQ
jgi:hypothetical protein